MGLDVNLYAECEPTPDRLAEATQAFVAAVKCADEYAGHWEALTFDEDKWLPRPRVSANVTQRYYGPGYERGSWPMIYVAIEVLRHLFPEAEVFYGGDSDDYGQLVTDEFLAEMWRHYLGPDGNAYRERRANRTTDPRRTEAADPRSTDEQD